MAYAQTLSLSVSPPILQITTQPGKIITHACRLKNEGDDTWISAQVLPFKPLANGQVQLPADLTAETYQHPYLNWFSFQNADIDLPGRFPLKSGQDQQLVLKLRVPEMASSGDYYLSLVFQTDRPDNLDQSASSQAGLIAINVLLTVAETEFPTINGQTELKLLNWSQPLIDSLDKLKFQLTTTNTGDFRFQAQGKIKISRGDKLIKTLELQPENVLAQSERLQLFDWHEHGLLLGKYTAQVDIQADPNTSFSDQISFYALPYKILLILVLAIGFTIILKSLLDNRLRKSL